MAEAAPPEPALDKQFAEGQRAVLKEMRDVRKIKNIGPLRRLCRGFGVDSTGDKNEMKERIIDHLDLRPDYAALYAAENFTCKADLSSKAGVTIEYLRFICEAEGVATAEVVPATEAGAEKEKNIARPKLEASLAAKLVDKLPGFSMKRPKKQKSFNEKVKINLHRLNQTFFLLCFLWDGVKWGGSCVRSKVIEKCKAKYGAALSDEEAVRAACEGSAFFTGLWCFFEIELRMVVEPLMDWERGDISMFLRLFPLMCMYVSSSHKIKIPRVLLMIAERLKLYVDKHVNVIKLFAANCIQFDEEKIEFANAVIGRWMPARVKNIDISHYIRVTCVMKCIRAINSSFSRLFNRKEQENENERLRTMYTKQRWDPTRVEVCEFIIDLFDKALDGTFGDELWPRENPFALGLMRIRNKYARELNAWNEQQVKIGEGAEEDEDDEEEDESSEEEEDESSEGEDE